jgi:hypothetical protein
LRESKLYKTLESLYSTDLNRLDKFIQSPYFNSDSRLVEIFKIIKQDIRGTTSKTLEKEEIWRLIEPKKEFNDTVFRSLINRVIKLIQEFLYIEELRANPMEEGGYLLSAIEKRGLSHLTSTAIKTSNTKLAREQLRSSSYYYQKYQLEKNAYDLNQTELKRLNRKAEDVLNLEDILDNLELFYIGEKLKYHCSILGWKKLLSSEGKAENLAQLIERVKVDPRFKVPHIQMYLCIYQTLVNPDSSDAFEKLKNLIDVHIELFPTREAKNVLDAANNFCLRKINKGEIGYLKELFSLYKKGLKTEILLVNNYISPWAYKNIVGVALRLKEFDWAEQFIVSYSTNLERSYKKSIYSLSMAQLNYYQQNYRESINYLQQVEFKEFALKVNAEVTLIATYYELEEFNALADTLTNFSKFLKRRKDVSASQKNLYQNLIKFLRKIISPKSKTALLKIKDEIETTQGLASKSWLLEKVNELLGEPI